MAARFYLTASQRIRICSYSSGSDGQAAQEELEPVSEGRIDRTIARLEKPYAPGQSHDPRGRKRMLPEERIEVSKRRFLRHAHCLRDEWKTRAVDRASGRHRNAELHRNERDRHHVRLRHRP